MDGLYFLASIIVFLLIEHWAWRNDALSWEGRTAGFFRMRASMEPKSGKSIAVTAETSPQDVESIGAVEAEGLPISHVRHHGEQRPISS